MHIQQPTMWKRGKLVYNGPAPHITPDSLCAELTQMWGPRGFKVYKTKLVGLDVVCKKSGWTGIGIKIKQSGGNTELAYNAFAPSAFVRMMFMGLIPILIVNSSSWQPLLRQFEAYVQGSPFFGGQQQLQAGMYGQQPGMYGQQQPMQQYGQQPMQQQAGMYGQQQPMQQQPMAVQQQPCPRCQSPLNWIAEHQRWYCGACQQYV